LRTSTRPRLEHDLPSGAMLIQTRGVYGGRGGDSTSVECLFSITPSFRRAEEEEDEEEEEGEEDVQRRSSVCSQKPLCLGPDGRAGGESQRLVSDADDEVLGVEAHDCTAAATLGKHLNPGPSTSTFRCSVGKLKWLHMYVYVLSRTTQVVSAANGLHEYIFQLEHI